MVAYRLTSIRSLARFLGQNPELTKTCGFKKKKVPSYRTFCRRFGCLNNWVLQWCRILLTWLVENKLLKIKLMILDGTPCKSKCNKPKKFGARTITSDPEARFGCTGKKKQSKNKDWFFGYKSMILASSEPLIIPLAWQVVPANQPEVKQLIPTTKQTTWLLENDQRYDLIADAGFDAQGNYDWCKKINIRFTCPLNPANKPRGKRLKRQKFYQSKQGQKLYQRRSDIERLNSHLKDLFLIDPFPVKGLNNANTYLSLAMLCYLAGICYNFQNNRKPRSIKSLIA